MVYIVVVNPKGFRDFEQEEVFDNFKQAHAYMRDFISCHGGECEYRLFRALNEFTNKRQLVKQVL